MKKILILALSFFLLTGCSNAQNAKETVKEKVKETQTVKKLDYGLYTNMTKKQVLNLKYQYNTLVISKGYNYKREEIQTLKENTTKDIYTKYSIGKNSNYKQYKKSKYVDVTNKEFKKHIEEVANSFKYKEFTGVYLSGFNIYDKYVNSDDASKLMDSLVDILQIFNNHHLTVVVTDGQQFVNDYLINLNDEKAAAEDQALEQAENDEDEEDQEIKENPLLIQYVYAEEVFTVYNKKTKKTKKQKTEYSTKYKEYFENVSASGVKVIDVEFTRNSDWEAVVKTYCKNRGYDYYILKNKDKNKEEA